jgi:hypothetical protein
MSDQIKRMISIVTGDPEIKTSNWQPCKMIRFNMLITLNHCRKYSRVSRRQAVRAGASHSSRVYYKIADLIKISWQTGNPGQVFDDRQTRIRLVCRSPKQTIPVSQLSKQNNFGLPVTRLLQNSLKM